MAFNPIDNNTIKVGDPITKDILDLIKANFDDHELRINSLATTGGTVFIFNGDVSFVNYSSLRPDIFYYTARQDFSVNDFRARLFTKDGITSGNLTLRLEKSNDPNDANFLSILTSDISFNFATDTDYTEEVASLNASLNDITTGQILRIKVMGIPSGFTGKILLSIGAQ
jgi:hypothetical protein